MNIARYIKDDENLFNILFFLITILPISLLLGSAIINTTVVIINLLF